MPSAAPRPSIRARAALALAAAACAVLATAAPAAAAPTTYGGGHLDWGIKESFRSYIVGPIAHGSYTASEGATKLSEPNGVVRFDVLGGSYDDATGVGELTIDGAVRFQGHEGTLDTTLRSLCVGLAGGGVGTLYADVVSKNRDSGVTSRYYGIALAELPAVPAPTPTAGGLTWASIPTRLTASGEPAFGQYPAGTDFDPIEPLTVTAGTPRSRPAGGGCRGVAPPADDGDAPGPAPSAVKPSLQGARKAVTVGRSRIATIATLRCGSAACTVKAPKSVKAKVKGKRYKLRVLAPKALAAGKSGKVRVKLPKAAHKALAGRRAKLKVKVTVAAGGASTTKTIRATLFRGVRHG